MGVLVLETELVRGEQRNRSVGHGEQQRQQRRLGRDEIEAHPRGQDGGEQPVGGGERLPADEEDERQGKDRDRDRGGEAAPGRGRKPVRVGRQQRRRGVEHPEAQRRRGGR